MQYTYLRTDNYKALFLVCSCVDTIVHNYNFYLIIEEEEFISYNRFSDESLT